MHNTIVTIGSLIDHGDFLILFLDHGDFLILFLDISNSENYEFHTTIPSFTPSVPQLQKCYHHFQVCSSVYWYKSF